MKNVKQRINNIRQVTSKTKNSKRINKMKTEISFRTSWTRFYLMSRKKTNLRARQKEYLTNITLIRSGRQRGSTCIRTCWKAGLATTSMNKRWKYIWKQGASIRWSIAMRSNSFTTRCRGYWCFTFWTARRRHRLWLRGGWRGARRRSILGFRTSWEKN